MSLLQIQRLENTIEELRQKNKEQENIINELKSITVKPSFSVEDKVSRRSIMDNYLNEETRQEIIERLIRNIDVLKEDKRALYTVINEAQQTINKLKQTIDDFIVKPKFEVGDKVNMFHDSDTTYIIQCFMYEQSYPVYNIIPVDSTNESTIETVLESDLIKI